MATLLLILAIGWLLFSLCDWIFANFKFWQLTTIIPTPIFFLVDLFFVITGLLANDSIIVVLAVISFILQLRFADWQPIVIWHWLLTLLAFKNKPNSDLVSLDKAKLTQNAAAPKSELESLKSQLEKINKFRQQTTLKLRIFNWNTLFWHHDEAELAAFLHSQNADIYHLQEAWLTTLAAYNVEDFVKTYFPNYFFYQHFDIVTISKYPITNVLAGTNCLHFGCWLRVDINVNGQQVSAYNIHMPVPFEIAYIFKPKLFWQYYQIFQKARIFMSNEIENDFSQNNLAFVVTGDFNTIKRQPPVRKWLLKSSLKEANSTFLSKSFNKNTSEIKLKSKISNIFPVTLKAFKKLPFWRVDWAFTSKFSVEQYERLDYNTISDHYPIVVDLSLTKGEKS